MPRLGNYSRPPVTTNNRRPRACRCTAHQPHTIYITDFEDSGAAISGLPPEYDEQLPQLLMYVDGVLGETSALAHDGTGRIVFEYPPVDDGAVIAWELYYPGRTCPIYAMARYTE